MATFSQEQAPDWAWAKSAGGNLYDYSQSITTDAVGNVYITGVFSSSTLTFGNTTLINAGGCDVFIAKYDPNGNVLWAKSAGDNNTDCGTGITTDVVGNVYLTGRFSSTITFGNITLSSAGDIDIFIVKYDSDGNVLWAQSAGGNSEDEIHSIATDAVGNVYITGYFNSSTLTLGNITLANTYAWRSDIFIAKYDPNGNVLWAKSAGGSDTDCGIGIAADAVGNVYQDRCEAKMCIKY